MPPARQFTHRSPQFTFSSISVQFYFTRDFFFWDLYFFLFSFLLSPHQTLPVPGTKSVLTFNTLNTSNALSRTFGRSWLERQFVFAGFWLTRLFIFAGLHAVVSSKSITFLHVRRVRSRIAFYLHTCCAQLGIVYTKN